MIQVNSASGEDTEEFTSEDEDGPEDLDSFDSDVEDEMSALNRSQRALDAQVGTWSLEARGQSQITETPLASRLTHSVMNPHLYRNLLDAGGLDGLAQILHAPTNWEAQYTDLVITNKYAMAMFENLRRLPENPPFERYSRP